MYSHCSLIVEQLPGEKAGPKANEKVAESRQDIYAGLMTYSSSSSGGCSIIYLLNKYNLNKSFGSEI